MKSRAILLSAFLALAFVPATEAEIYNCGVVDVIFLNPDLNDRAENGIIDASGSFFAQFQVIGDRAEEVEYIGFSFGKDFANQDESVCPTDEGYDGNYYSGQQILNYRADLDPSDGFFINLQTALVPDGDYSAAVHAFDADDNELGRFWAQAVVNNCDESDEDGRCGGDTPEEEQQRINNDNTQPWPIILPGDGELADGTGFTIEVAEELSDWEVLLNGEDITGELEDWEGREWDNDLRPGYGPFGALGENQVTSECSIEQPQVPQANECSTLGQAFKWTKRNLDVGEVLNVRLVDLAGNVAKKDIHVGFGITGGISSGAYPILQWQTEETRAEANPGTSVDFTFTIQNLGAETGHPFAKTELQEVPAGWTWDWTDHQSVGSGEETTNVFTVHVPNNATDGSHQVTAGMEYVGQNNDVKQLQQILTIDVVGGSNNEPVEGDLDGDGIPDDEKDTPGLGTGIVSIALLGAAMVAARRRA